MSSLTGPFHHKPLKEEIFEVLHQRIIAGIHTPGEWLRQEDIAQEMGVSMTPVREALDLLVSAGLAERIPYRGVRVADLSPREIIEAYGKRLLLEGMAARMAAKCITEQEILALARLLDEMQQHVTLKEMSRSRQLSREFHHRIVRASGDGLLVRLYEIVTNTFPDWMLYEAMFRHPELLTFSLIEEHTEHRTLLEALARHDANDASQAALKHVLHMGKNLETLLEIPGTALREQEAAVIPFISN